MVLRHKYNSSEPFDYGRWQTERRRLQRRPAPSILTSTSDLGSILDLARHKKRAKNVPWALWGRHLTNDSQK